MSSFSLFNSVEFTFDLLETSSRQVLMLTAKVAEKERIEGIDAGARDNNGSCAADTRRRLTCWACPFYLLMRNSSVEQQHELALDVKSISWRKKF